MNKTLSYIIQSEDELKTRLIESFKQMPFEEVNNIRLQLMAVNKSLADNPNSSQFAMISSCLATFGFFSVLHSVIELREENSSSNEKE